MAVVTFTTTTQEDAHMAFAVGRTLRLVDAGGAPRDATGPEIKTYWIGEMRSLVRARRMEEAAAAITPISINPT
jgi:hypothetical protein